MRLTRLVIGVLVILVAGFIIAGEQLAGASADAVINARLTTIRAPIAGSLGIERRPLGSTVTVEEALGSIRDEIVDDIRLNDLLLEHSVSTAEAKRLRDTIAAIESTIAALSERSQSYKAERIRQLEAELKSSQAQIAAAQARVEEAAAAFSRSEQLSRRGLEASASFERMRTAQRVAMLELEDARQRAEASDIVLQSARRGTFLGDGYNDAPYSEQQISELSLRVLELKSALATEEARMKALDQRIAAERLRVNRLGGTELRSNVNGRVWEVMAGDGETVQRGQDLMRLIDCQSTIVTLSVTEAVYNQLELGSSAIFRVGSNGRSFDGTVTRLAGSGAETIYRNLAVAPSEKHLERYDVALLVPGLREDPDLGCAVGRTGRAFFEARPLDLLRGIWR